MRLIAATSLCLLTQAATGAGSAFQDSAQAQVVAAALGHVVALARHAEGAPDGIIMLDALNLEPRVQRTPDSRAVAAWARGAMRNDAVSREVATLLSRPYSRDSVAVCTTPVLALCLAKKSSALAALVGQPLRRNSDFEVTVELRWQQRGNREMIEWRRFSVMVRSDRWQWRVRSSRRIGSGWMPAADAGYAP